MTEQEQPRITPEAALAAYQQTGLRPMQAVYCTRNCACALGALHVAASNPAYASVRAPANKIYGEGYVGGFMEGFDGAEDLGGYTSDRERQGYEDGKAVWAAVQHLAEVAT